MPKYDFHCANWHEIITFHKFLWTSPIPNFAMCRKYRQIKIYVPKYMYALHCTDYHKTYSCSAALCRHILYRISPKSVKAYAKHGRNSLTHLGKVWLPAAIFMKLTLVQLPVMNSYTESHKNPINGSDADTVTNGQTFFFYCPKHKQKFLENWFSEYLI
jgi:hypothetical protein